MTSFSGNGGGGEDDRPLAVLVEVVERTDATDFSLRGDGLVSVVVLVVFLDLEGPACEVVDTADAFELRLIRELGEGGTGLDGVDFRLAAERSEAPDCFLCLGTVSLEVDDDNSERALLKVASLFVVAEEADLERSALTDLVDCVEDRRGRVSVTTDGARRDLMDGAGSEGAAEREGVEDLEACEVLAESALRLMVLRGTADRILLVTVETVTEESVVETDLTELAEDIRRLRTDGDGVEVLTTVLRSVVGRNELATLVASSSLILRV